MCLESNLRRILLQCHVFSSHSLELQCIAFSPSDEFKSRKRHGTKSVVREEGQNGDGVRRGREEGGEGTHERRRETLENRIRSNPTSELYLQWRENTLRQARERLLESES